MFLASRYNNFSSNDRVGLLAHFWVNSLFATLATGGSLYFYDLPARGPQGLAGWLRSNQVTVINTYVAAFRALEMDASTRLPNLRVVRLSGDLLMRNDLERFESLVKVGAEMHNGYVATECSYITAFVHKAEEPIQYDRLPIGAPCEPNYFAIVDISGNRVPTVEAGEMVIYSRCFMNGYFNDPVRTAAAFRPLPNLNVEQAYFTGGQGYFDTNGIVHPIGRADDQVKIRGYVVRPNEIEDTIRRFGGFKQVAVAAFDGPRKIRQLACHLVPATAGSPTIAELRTFLRAELPGYMVPSQYLLHDTLPATSTGKIMRRALPNPLDRLRDIRPVMDAATTETERVLVAIWSDILGHGDFGTDEDFFDVGGDSLQVMSMVVSIEKQLNRRLTLETLVLDGATIQQLAERIDEDNSGRYLSRQVLNRGGIRESIFAAPVIGGHLSDYLALAHRLESLHPVIGLPFDTANLALRAQFQIEDLAEPCVAMLPDTGQRSVILMGYSFGDVVALEAARKLAASGRHVNLILLDALPEWTDPLRLVRSVWRTAKRGNLAASQRKVTEVLGGAVGLQVQPQTIEEAHIGAIHRYKSRQLRNVSSLLLVADANPKAAETRSEWKRLLCDQLTIENVAGNHFTMMRDPNVAGLARKVRDWLERR